MSRSRKNRRRDQREVEVPDPVDVVDGIADRSARPRIWKYVVLGAVFIGWLCFLIWSAAAGGIGAK